ncbi:MAG: transporter [Planctomycetes bacterium]|nr:transporter [Planctomycetota bacterium]
MDEGKLRTEMRGAAAMLVVGVFALNAHAQEAMWAEAATQPPSQTLRYRPMAHYVRYGGSPSGKFTRAEELSIEHEFAFALKPDVSLSVTVPTTYRTTKGRTGGDATDEDSGIGDITALAKIRWYKDDTGPIDTVRSSIFFGAEIPSGHEQLSSKSVDPIVGVATTWIRKRWGGTFTVGYKMNTNQEEEGLEPGDAKADAFNIDNAVMYRLAPEKFTMESKGAWYLIGEVNGIFETNADHEVMLSPGLMYEGWTWAFEASIQLPILQQVDHRPERRFVVGLGLRFLF